MSLHDTLTYIIPTRNRPEFLHRQLYFLEAMHEQASIRIVDSSKAREKADNQRLVARFRPRLRLDYSHTNAGIISKCRRALEQVQTPYVLFCADDDFLIPTSVHRCVEFLQRAPDYSCAHGMIIGCESATGRCEVLPAFSIEADDPIKRFRRMATNRFTTFYSVYRTPLLLRAFQLVDARTRYERARIFPELLLLQLSVLYGKARYVPGLYFLHEGHERNESRVVPEIADPEHRADIYRDFRECLSEELAEVCGTSLDCNRKIVDRCFGHLKDGRKSVWFRIRGEAVKACRRWRAFFQRDGVLVRRRFFLKDPLCQTDAWQLAYGLMREYPRGMCLDTSSSCSVA